MEEAEVKKLKGNLVGGLKNYFNNDIQKVKDFAECIKYLGFNLDDLDTLKLMEKRSEALITMLGLFEFGALQSVVKSIKHLRGQGNPDEYIEKHVNIFSKPNNTK